MGFKGIDIDWWQVILGSLAIGIVFVVFGLAYAVTMDGYRTYRKTISECKQYSP